MIECLLYLNSKIKVKGEFDFGRGWILTNGGKGTNLNDHVCGRGIDIFEVGESEDNMIDLKSRDLNKHKEALNIILKHLATMPQNIHPDLLVVHDGLAEEYGMQTGGFDIDVKGGPTGGILQKQYQYLRNVNFHPDAGHQNHIHLAFSPWRAGNYKNWTVRERLSQGSLQDAIDFASTIPITTTPIASSALEQLFTTFEPGTALPNKDVLYRALVQYGGFSPEVAATFMMLAERESHFQPGVLNSGKKDWSIGLFQTNYSDTTNSSFASRTVNLSTLLPNGTIRNEKIALWKLLVKDWQSRKPQITDWIQATQVIKEYRLQKKGREIIDPRLFQPINQINLLLSYVEDYKNRRWKFSSWGEYPDGPKYGWITATKIQTAVDYYVRNNPGKTKNDYITWANGLKTNMINKNALEKYSAWLQGQFFKD